MSYEPKEFWEQRLSSHFDLRGTGETGLSLAYNVACYTLRRDVLTRALRDAGLDLRGRRVLDVGCGTGFFVEHYLRLGANVTGCDLTSVSIERLARQLPEARFLRADISDVELGETFDVVNAFDVVYHIVDDARWESAVRRMARAVAPGGALLLTDLFADAAGLAEHNRIRPMERYRAVLEQEGLVPGRTYATHLLLNSELGPLRFLNRLPGLLLALDRLLLAVGADRGRIVNRILVSRRPNPDAGRNHGAAAPESLAT